MTTKNTEPFSETKVRKYLNCVLVSLRAQVITINESIARIEKSLKDGRNNTDTNSKGGE